MMLARRISSFNTARHSFMALQYICHFTRPLFSARLQSRQQGWSTHVDLALRLDVLAVCAVFAFIGAILLGAFCVRVVKDDARSPTDPDQNGSQEPQISSTGAGTTPVLAV